MPLKKRFILHSKGAHFENRHHRKHRQAWPLHFKFASYAYVYVLAFGIVMKLTLETAKRKTK